VLVVQRAVGFTAATTIGLLALTEQFAQLPAAVAAFAAAHWIASHDDPTYRATQGPRR
jgi:hypothetical protein